MEDKNEKKEEKQDLEIKHFNEQKDSINTKDTINEEIKDEEIEHLNEEDSINTNDTINEEIKDEEIDYLNEEDSININDTIDKEKSVQIIEMETKIIDQQSMIEILKEEISTLKTRNLREINALKDEIESFAELINYKRGSINELIITRESYFRTYNDYLLKEEEYFNKNTTLETVNDIIEELETLLLNNDVQISKINPDEKVYYNWREHTKINFISTEEEELNGVISNSLGNKYILDDKIIYKERVNVYKLKENKEEEAN